MLAPLFLERYVTERRPVARRGARSATWGTGRPQLVHEEAPAAHLKITWLGMTGERTPLFLPYHPDRAAISLR